MPETLTLVDVMLQPLADVPMPEWQRFVTCMLDSSAAVETAQIV